MLAINYKSNSNNNNDSLKVFIMPGHQVAEKRLEGIA
jgi:hypothetical protein